MEIIVFIYQENGPPTRWLLHIPSYLPPLVVVCCSPFSMSSSPLCPNKLHSLTLFFVKSLIWEIHHQFFTWRWSTRFDRCITKHEPMLDCKQSLKFQQCAGWAVLVLPFQLSTHSGLYYHPRAQLPRGWNSPRGMQQNSLAFLAQALDIDRSESIWYIVGFSKGLERF